MILCGRWDWTLSKSSAFSIQGPIYNRKLSPEDEIKWGVESHDVEGFMLSLPLRGIFDVACPRMNGHRGYHVLCSCLVYFEGRKRFFPLSWWARDGIQMKRLSVRKYDMKNNARHTPRIVAWIPIRQSIFACKTHHAICGSCWRHEVKSCDGDGGWIYCVCTRFSKGMKLTESSRIFFKITNILSILDLSPPLSPNLLEQRALESVVLQCVAKRWNTAWSYATADAPHSFSLSSLIVCWWNLKKKS